LLLGSKLAANLKTFVDEGFESFPALLSEAPFGCPDFNSFLVTGISTTRVSDSSPAVAGFAVLCVDREVATAPPPPVPVFSSLWIELTVARTPSGSSCI